MAMRHIEDGSIQLLLAGELDDRETRRVREHMAECDTCARRFHAAEREDREIASLMGALDHAVPEVDPDDVIGRAARRDRRSYIAAAAIVFLALAGAAAAMPGSPVRSWVAGLLLGSQGGQGSQTAGVPGGVSVAPVGEFELAFEVVQEAGVIRVILIDADELAVSASGGSPRYSIGPNEVRVDNTGSTADYEVSLPRSAPHISITVAGTTVLTQRDGEVMTTGDPDSSGSYSFDFEALPAIAPSGR